MVDQRYELLTQWLAQYFDTSSSWTIQPLAGDASFRRYFRVFLQETSYVVMDAPPPKENCAPYVAIAHALSAQGLQAPHIFAKDLQQGFLLLSDFGDQLLFNALNTQTVDTLYHQAFDHLVVMQKITAVPGYTVPVFEQGVTSYRGEMELFETWYLNQHLQQPLTVVEKTALNKVIDLLGIRLKAQPHVFVHRDYHSRNLMVTEKNLGILDFQDAVFGPVSYDLVSLLRDCYIDWAPETVDRLVFEYHEKAQNAGVLPASISKEQFLMWFDMAGLQRNLKCIGLFARLNIRDHKPGYLKDIPRVISYAKQVCARHAEFSALGDILKATK